MTCLFTAPHYSYFIPVFYFSYLCLKYMLDRLPVSWFIAETLNLIM